MTNHEIVNSDIDALVKENPFVLIFLPNTNELQRFVIAGAFDELVKNHQLHYVLPSNEAAKMRSAAPDILTSSNTSELEIAPERFAIWSDLFQSACYHFSGLSPSFAIRANLDLRPGQWRLIRILPQRAWEPACRVIRYLLGFQSWPKAVRSRLDGWFYVLRSSIMKPEKYGLIHDKTYTTVVNTTLQRLEPLQEITRLFDRVAPLYCIVPSSLLDIFCNDVVLACEREKVACVILQSGWDNLSSKGILHSRSPYLGCWGPQSKAHAIKIQSLKKDKCFNLGAPHYEFLTPASDADITEIRSQLGVGEKMRLVLFGGSFRQFDETGTLLRLEQAIEEGCLGLIKIVYRPHPWRSARKHEDSFFKYEWKHVVFDPDMSDRYVREQNEAGYIKHNVPMFDMVYLSRLLSSVDAVISPMSTLLIESLIMRKPTMAIAFGDGKHSHDPSVTSQMTHFIEAKKSGAFLWCDASDRLIDDCTVLLTPEKAETLMNARSNLLGQIVIREPGTYAERLAHFCQEKIEPDARSLRLKRASFKRITISHAYSAHRIALNYCGATHSNPIIPGYWMHGWIPEFHNDDPVFIALHKKDGQHQGYDYAAQIRNEKENIMQWVSRQDQAEYLLANGYKHVQAIGLPVIYIPKPKIPRIPGSLLVLPPHSHKTHGPDDPLANLYASVIADLKPRFEHIWVGLNEDDITKCQWVESFRRQGINVFKTTDQTDPDTLVRLVRILSGFEYVTTNGFGSHIALAAYLGAKVSVYGPFAEFPLERMKATHSVKMFPHLLQQAFELCTEDSLRKHYPFLFVEPDKASQLEAWGAHEVGESYRLSPDGLMEAFGWDRLNPSDKVIQDHVGR